MIIVPRTVFGICCWIGENSQLPELKRCLDSVKDFKVILVNGKWYDIEGDNPHSTEEAQKLIDSYPNVTRIDYADHHEWEARNKYLEACDKDDVLIWLDTDEYVSEFSNFAKVFFMNLSAPSFYVNCFSHRHGGAHKQKRGITYPFATRHQDRHNEAFLPNGLEVFKNPVEGPQGLVITHDKSFRSEKREIAMKKRNKLRPYR